MTPGELFSAFYQIVSLIYMVLASIHYVRTEHTWLWTWRDGRGRRRK